MKIYLARHGQTNYNEARLCNSDPAVDVHLTKVGIKQAKKLAEDLKDVNLQRIFVSELKRTQQTAEIINQYHHAPTTIDARLNDNRSGFESKPVDDYYAELHASPNKWEARLNDGESIADVKERVNGFLEDLKENKYEAVLVVTSKVIVQIFQGIIDNLSYEDLWELSAERGSCKVINI